MSSVKILVFQIDQVGRSGQHDAGPHDVAFAAGAFQSLLSLGNGGLSFLNIDLLNIAVQFFPILQGRLRLCVSRAEGVKAGSFPNVPVDYGYRDSTYFWYTRFRRPRKEPIPAGKEMAVDSVIFAANRIDPEIKFTKEACQMCVKIPRVFLKAALTQMVDYAREKGWKLIDVPQLKEIQDKRSKEKNQRRR